MKQNYSVVVPRDDIRLADKSRCVRLVRPAIGNRRLMSLYDKLSHSSPTHSLMQPRSSISILKIRLNLVVNLNYVTVKKLVHVNCTNLATNHSVVS